MKAITEQPSGQSHEVSPDHLMAAAAFSVSVEMTGCAAARVGGCWWQPYSEFPPRTAARLCYFQIW